MFVACFALLCLAFDAVYPKLASYGTVFSCFGLSQPSPSPPRAVLTFCLFPAVQILYLCTSP